MAKLLLVEDDLVLNTALKTKLENIGHTVLTGFNGNEGLEILKNNIIDLVLVDIVMPKMDGIEMLYQWDQQKDHQIPVLILTNLSETSYPEYVNKILVKSNTSLQQIIQEIEMSLSILE